MRRGRGVASRAITEVGPVTGENTNYIFGRSVDPFISVSMSLSGHVLSISVFIAFNSLSRGLTVLPGILVQEALLVRP